ncbi:hypothetical protein [Actinoallomurus soli]|nr:hypothetical protein [Actinoallomurus soli]
MPGAVIIGRVAARRRDVPGSAFEPDDIAGHYWRLHAQPRRE